MQANVAVLRRAAGIKAEAGGTIVASRRLPAMRDVVRHVSESLRRYYAAVIDRPMPWTVIDKLETLKETEESAEARLGASAEPNAQSNDGTASLPGRSGNDHA